MTVYEAVKKRAPAFLTGRIHAAAAKPTVLRRLFSSAARRAAQ
jgi:hypothetical protein